MIIQLLSFAENCANLVHVYFIYLNNSYAVDIYIPSFLVVFMIC